MHDPKEFQWQRAFAWLPRRAEGRWIWWRWYEKRRSYFDPLNEERRLPSGKD
jgi:hypothetical protein